MPMNAEDIERLIADALPDAAMEIKDLRGNGDSFAAYIESSAFWGKSRVDQHRIVFAALEGRVGSLIQTLSLMTVPVQG